MTRTTFLALAPLLLVPVFTAAQAVTTPLAGVEIFDPLNLFHQGSVGSILNAGELTCPGTTPTGNPMQPCPAGSRINMRDAALKSRLASQDARLAGWFNITGNSDLDSNATGVAWGTFQLELEAGGAWEGTWIGNRTQMEGLAWVTRISGVGRGTGGSVDGKQLLFSETVISFAPVSVAYVGDITAEVFSPPSK
jgi:hypothetical protein